MQTPDKPIDLLEDEKSIDRKSSIKSVKKTGDEVSQVSKGSSPYKKKVTIKAEESKGGMN
jgi:cytochrome c556